jgi:phosphate transport system substrate-binding protein
MRMLLSISVALTMACGSRASDAAVIAVDGSSTVFPISEAVAEEFKKRGQARVTVGMSGTGGGFKKFCKGEVVVTGASRPIKGEEVELCRAGGVEYVELPVAYDGIAVVVNPAATWIDHITVEELARLWEPKAQGKVMRWSDVRADWPADEIHLFGAGVDSGTYDYFTQAIVGTEHASRGDYTSSEDDNVLVQGIASDKNALGFFGFAYYAENAAKLKLVPVDDGNASNGDGPVAPSVASVNDGTYQPLSRPMFIYVAKQAAERAEVAAFIEFYLTEGPALVKEVGYIPLPDAAYELVRARFSAKTPGSAFGGEGSKVGARIEDVLRAR